MITTECQVWWWVKGKKLALTWYCDSGVNGIRQAAHSQQHPSSLAQESGSGWRMDEVRPAVNGSSFHQCFDTVGWLTYRASSPPLPLLKKTQASFLFSFSSETCRSWGKSANPDSPKKWSKWFDTRQQAAARGLINHIHQVAPRPCNTWFLGIVIHEQYLGRFSYFCGLTIVNNRQTDTDHTTSRHR